MQAYNKNLENILGINDTANHLLGQYIRVAISDVFSGKNNYPKEPFIVEAEKNKRDNDNNIMDAEAMERVAMRNTAIMAGKRLAEEQRERR